MNENPVTTWEQFAVDSVRALRNEMQEFRALAGLYSSPEPSFVVRCAWNGCGETHAGMTASVRDIERFGETAPTSAGFGRVLPVMRAMVQSYPLRLVDSQSLCATDDPEAFARDLYVLALSLVQHRPTAATADGQLLYDFCMDASVVSDTMKHIEQQSQEMKPMVKTLRRGLRDQEEELRLRLKRGQYFDRAVGTMAERYDVLETVVDVEVVKGVLEAVENRVAMGEVTLLEEFVEWVRRGSDKKSRYT
ncbi:hypothetical protein EXIGLDRAFT_769636 [Exidia glandulosa HHB12029]|uniref:Uncharacterized protein n=1 Tax=Exidia glandulosa HHB12029 TaxID=1314781 RepID=A0A165HAL5_EXIGL|nr:hypothetical protein EXIGLDRAFT_769636 [Exidia glandulosa HHB12029]